MQRLVFGDVARLRAAYPNPTAFAAARRALWLPDALSGSTTAAWVRQFGFGLGNVERFIAGGLHPLELAVAPGQFEPKIVRLHLRRAGYKPHGALLQHGRDTSVDWGSAVGRLAQGSLDRVAIERGRLVAASTTALAQAELAGKTALSANADLRLVAHALGPVTAAAIIPRELVPSAPAAPAAHLATHRASFLGIGVDDGGPSRRTLRIALAYPSAAEANLDRAPLESKLAGTALPSHAGMTFGDVLHGLTVTIDGRVLLLSARVDDPREWRQLLRRGDLAGLVASG